MRDQPRHAAPDRPGQCVPCCEAHPAGRRRLVAALVLALARAPGRLATGKRLAAVALAVAWAVAASLASAALADRPHIERLVRLSGGTPFPGPCGASAVAQRDAEVETSIAVDPRTPRRIVAAWMQDDGRSNLVMASPDGGRSWSRVLVPGLTDCTGGTVSAAADPWLSFAPDGKLLLGSGTANLPHLPGPSSGPQPSQVVSRSDDGGLSWSLPATVQFAPGVYSDKSAVTADPFRRRWAYDAWDVRSGPEEETSSAWFSRSSDGGRTWSPPRRVYDPGEQQVGPLVTEIAVLPHRVLLDVMQVQHGASTIADVMAARSVDGGRTWSRPALIARGSASEAIDPDAGTVALGTVITSVAVGPDGVPTVAWNDIASPHFSRVLVSRSKDGGRSWSRPLAVSRVAGQAIQADVAAAGDGTLGITWYDDRRDPGGSKAAWNFDVWFAFSRDRGHRWRQMHLAGPFDMNRAQALEGVGRRIGDYQTLAGLPHGFAAIFTQAPPQAKIGASDAFFARIGTGHRPRRPRHRR
jgi:BNR repeat protein